MDHYIELRLLPDPEFPTTVLMNALFAKFHRALASMGEGGISVSFPHAEKTPGDCLRLHGDKAALEKLMATQWLKGMRDYTAVSAIEAVPRNCRYRTVKRVQAKSSAERLRRRSIKKGWLTREEAEEKITNDVETRIKLPFIQMKSQSTGQSFRLFFEQGDPVDTPRPGEFSAYGLSATATIPHF